MPIGTYSDPALSTGLFREDVFQVSEAHTAPQIGSGDVPVLATPILIAFLERTAHRLVSDHLPPGTSSVGVAIEARHLAPTPVGEPVRVRAEIVGLQGTRVTLDVQAWDSQELVGTGSHERVVIDLERFLRRVAAKQSARHP